MASKIYLGVGDTAKKVSKIYLGVGDTAKKVKKVYLGVGDKAKLVWQAGTPVGNLAVGSTIYVNEGGAYSAWTVVHQGLPSSIYDSSCKGTWVWRSSSLDEFHEWNSTNSNYYAMSTIKTYVDSTFWGTLSSATKSAIKRAKIPYLESGDATEVTSGSSGLSVDCFLLSLCEMGISLSRYPIHDEEGAKLSYFTKTNSASAKRADAKNPAVRSPSMGDTKGTHIIKLDGSYYTVTSCTSKLGVRPAMILDPNAVIDPETSRLIGME